MNDVIGELSNIVGGNLKSIFSVVGLRCELPRIPFPAALVFKIESMNMERYERFAFGYQDHVFFVEFGLKLAERLNIPLDDVKEINYQVTDESRQSSAGVGGSFRQFGLLSRSVPGEIEAPVSRQAERPEELPAVYQQKNWVGARDLAAAR